MAVTTQETRPPKRRRKDLVSKRKHPLRRLWRFIRAIWYWVALASILYWALQDREVLNIVLTILAFAARMLSMIFLVVIQFGAIFWFMARSKTEIIRPEDPKTLTFEDYKGQPQLLKLVKQWISLLSDREKFQQMGGQFINGLLLYGPPGTGKTMLAKVMAGEAGVAFLSIEGSGFRAMFWGVDVLKMIAFIRKARKLAREYGACIAYIDEIDAVGSSRGGVMGGQTQTGMGMGMRGGMFGGGTGALTRLLYEMDGIEEKNRWEHLRDRVYKLLRRPLPKRSWHVLFMGSTNRPDSLDPALVRPGRFDRMLAVDKPDRSGRRAIVEYYLSKISHDDSIDVEAIVADTPDYTPAQIMAAITKDAVRMAIFEGRDRVTQRDVDMAFQEQAFGLENPIEDIDGEQLEQIAYHEAGHAIALHYLMPDKRIVRATIIRRSHALGSVHHADRTEQYAYPLTRFVRRIMVSLAGDAATRIRFGEPWVGTFGDYNQVLYNLSYLGTHGFFGPPVDNPMVMYRDKMTNFWKSANDKIERLLREHWEEVNAIAQALLEKDSLSGSEVSAIITKYSLGGGPPPEAPVELGEQPANVIAQIEDELGLVTDP